MSEKEPYQPFAMDSLEHFLVGVVHNFESCVFYMSLTSPPFDQWAWRCQPTSQIIELWLCTLKSPDVCDADGEEYLLSRFVE